MEALPEHLQAVLAVSQDAMLIVDASGTIATANAAADKLFGYRSGELKGMAIELLVPAHLRRLHAQARGRYTSAAIRRSASTHNSVHGLHKDGREIPIELALNALGTGLTIYSMRGRASQSELEDKLRQTIAETERRARAAEVDARRTHEHFKLFLKHAPAAIAMLDAQMRYLMVSDRWLSDYVLDDRDIHGLCHYDVFPNLPERWKELHRRCIAGETLSSDEDYFERTDGRIEWVRWTLQPWRNPESRVGGLFIFSEVITARKEAELALLQSKQQLEARVVERTAALEQLKDEADRANAQKSWFVAAASHDLRQPLQASLAYLTVLSRKTGNPELEELCEKARQPLKAMGDILDVLLDISDLESGRVQPRLNDFPISDLIARVVAGCQNQAQEKGLRLSYVPTTCSVHSDSKLLERVLSNFVTNAIRYTAKGLIGIYCEQAGDKICVSVSDTGIGIPHESLNAIFDDHVQLANPARDRRKGLGLGLSIAKRIADALGHRISVQSEVGAGSSFSIELPQALSAITPAQVVTAPAPQPAPAQSHPVVLLIDDDQDVAEAMQMLLQAYDYETYMAPSHEAAMAMLESGLNPGLVLCDYRLPGTTGLDVIRQVRRVLNAVVPAVLMTGDMGLQAVPDDIENCALLHKPVDVDVFFKVVHKLKNTKSIEYAAAS